MIVSNSNRLRTCLCRRGADVNHAHDRFTRCSSFAQLAAPTVTRVDVDIARDETAKCSLVARLVG